MLKRKSLSAVRMIACAGNRAVQSKCLLRRQLGYIAVGLLLGASPQPSDAADRHTESSLTIAQLIERSEQLSSPSDEVLPAPSDREPLALRTDRPTDARSNERLTSHQWLDIRPRSIEGQMGTLVAESDLPEDTSGLPDLHSASLAYVHRQQTNCQNGYYRSGIFCHRPLYFEDPYLERCGQLTACLRRVPSVHSTAHFLWKTSGFPVSLAVDPPWQRHANGFRTPYWIRVLKAHH